MKFKINNTEWTIKEISAEEMDYDKGNEGYYTHGYTSYKEDTIYINKTSPEKIRTLKHELTHCWLYMYGHCQDSRSFTNEDVCEIVASINDFINEVVEQYKREPYTTSIVQTPYKILIDGKDINEWIKECNKK